MALLPTQYPTFSIKERTLGHNAFRHDPCDQIDAATAIALLAYSEITAMDARHNSRELPSPVHNRGGLLRNGMPTCVRIVMMSAWQPTAASSRIAATFCIGLYSAGL